MTITLRHWPSCQKIVVILPPPRPLHENIFKVLYWLTPLEVRLCPLQVYLRSLPIVDLDIEIRIPSDPVDLLDVNKEVPGSSPLQRFPGTTLQICFRTLSEYMSKPSLSLPYKTFLWRTNLRRPKFWRSENMAKLNKNRHISDVTENKGIFHHFVLTKFSKNL